MNVIPTRSNGETITAAFFNTIKTIIDNDLVLTPLTVTADKTLGVDANVISADSSSGSIDLDLPALADNDKKYYILKATDLTNDVIVNPDGSDTIDGATEYTFANLNESIAIVGDATNSNWVIVATSFDSTGGSGGGADIPSTYLVLTPETYNISTWDTTNLANATFTLNTTAPLKGDSSYELSNITGCVDEYAFYDSIAVPLRSRGKTNSVQFPYITDGDTDDFSIEVYDVTNLATLETLSLETAPSTSKTASLTFYTPLTCEEIQFIVRVDVENNGTSLIFDDVVFSDDPFTYVDLTTSQSSYFGTLSQRGTTDTSVLMFGPEDRSSGSGDYEIASSTTLGTTITLLRNVESMNISFSGNFNSATPIMISLNSTVVATDTSILARGYTTSSERDSISVDQPFVAGDVIRILAPPSGGSVTDGMLSIRTLSESPAVVHSSTGTENTFSARIANDGTATITSQSSPNSPAIASVNRSATGTVDITLTSGFFTVAPAVVVTPFESPTAGNINAIVQTNSTTSITIITESTSAATDQDVDFEIFLQNQGADYKNPSAYAVTPLTQTCYIKDVKASGTAGGTFTQGAWQTRDLNTLSGDTSWCSLSSNQFTLPAGKYETEWDTPAFEVNGHQSSLYDITNSAYVSYGSNAVAGSSTIAGTSSRGQHQLTLSATTTFEVRHFCQSTKATTGYLNALSFGGEEVYTQVKITKLL